MEGDHEECESGDDDECSPSVEQRGSVSPSSVLDQFKNGRDMLSVVASHSLCTAAKGDDDERG